MKYFLPFILLLSVFTSGYAQDDPQKEKKIVAPTAQFLQNELDPLGRQYYPVVGVLPAAGAKIDPAVLKFAGTSLHNGLKISANRPFGTVQKEKFDDLRLILPYLSTSELKKDYWFESVNTQYLARLDFNRLKIIQTYDTLREDSKNPKTVTSIKGQYNAFANVNITFIDVATSNILVSTNLNLVGRDAISEKVINGREKPDSSKAMQSIYEQIKQHCSGGYDQVLSGVGVIDSILEEKKERAKVIKSNPNLAMILCGVGAQFGVYELGERYEADGMFYQHSALIGNVYKSRDFDRSKLNFDVSHGEKDILEAFRAGKKLMCAKGMLPLAVRPVDVKLPSILIDTFQSKNMATIELAKMLQEKSIDHLSKRNQLVSIVNRDVFQDIETERAIQSKMKSDLIQAGITTGADYVLSANILSYAFTREPVLGEKKQPEEPEKTTAQTKPAQTPAQTTPQTPPNSGTNNTSAAGSGQGRQGAQKNTPEPQKPAKNTPPNTARPATENVPAQSAPEWKPRIRFPETEVVGNKAKAVITVEARLVSVKTGEILWTRNISTAAEKQFGIDKSKFDKLAQQEEVNGILADNFGSVSVQPILNGIILPLPILSVLKTDKKGVVEKILVGGGQYAGIHGKTDLEVIEESIEMVENQALKRETVVADLRISDIFPETSAWKVQKGEDQLQARMAAKAKLYCRIKRL